MKQKLLGRACTIVAMLTTLAALLFAVEVPEEVGRALITLVSFVTGGVCCDMYNTCRGKYKDAQEDDVSKR